MILFFAAVLTAQNIDLIDKSVVTLKGSRPQFDVVHWVSKSQKRVLRKMQSTHSDKWRYARIICNSVKVDGHLAGCNYDRSYKVDLVVGKYASEIVKDAYLLKSAGLNLKSIKQVYIDLQFKYSGVKDTGDCGPQFCTYTPAPLTTNNL